MPIFHVTWPRIEKHFAPLNLTRLLQPINKRFRTPFFLIRHVVAYQEQRDFVLNQGLLHFKMLPFLVPRIREAYDVAQAVQICFSFFDFFYVRGVGHAELWNGIFEGSGDLGVLDGTFLAAEV